jgi:ATP phosphoribosyltransferase regulatory subunit
VAAMAKAATAAGAIHVDLADLRGYHYYTGATFSVFASDGRGAVVDCGRGGRYDGVGRAFGRARPATGFTLDLRRLAGLTGGAGVPAAILAPDDPDSALARAIAALRSAGETVVVALPGEVATIQQAARILARDGNEWRVVTRRQE